MTRLTLTGKGEGSTGGLNEGCTRCWWWLKIQWQEKIIINGIHFCFNLHLLNHSWTKRLKASGLLLKCQSSKHDLKHLKWREAKFLLSMKALRVGLTVKQCLPVAVEMLSSADTHPAASRPSLSKVCVSGCFLRVKAEWLCVTLKKRQM